MIKIGDVVKIKESSQASWNLEKKVGIILDFSNWDDGCSNAMIALAEVLWNNGDVSKIDVLDLDLICKNR